VIQPQLPLRLPCYDFAPVTDHTLDGCLRLPLSTQRLFLSQCAQRGSRLAHRLQVQPASVA